MMDGFYPTHRAAEMKIDLSAVFLGRSNSHLRLIRAGKRCRRIESTIQTGLGETCAGIGRLHFLGSLYITQTGSLAT